VPLIPYGSLWRYLDNGSDQGSLWRETAFNDSGWAAGFASLGYGDAARTILSYGPESTAKYPTTYFRHTFISGMINTSDALLIDFGQRDTPVQSGWQSYTARHEWVSSFLPQTYSAFGTTVTLNVAWLAGAFNITAQMYDAGDISSDTPDLLRDWIGTDRRFYGNPLTLTIIGLPPGVYNWLSYHHNIEIYTGLFDVTINDALGSVTTEDINISAGDLPFDSITTFRSAIVSDGSDITIVFDKHYSTLTLQSFFVMNGFKLTRQEYDTTGTLSALTLSLIRDDGAIVYLNVAEVVRDNMPAGTVDYLTHASTDVGDADEATPHVYTLSGAELITGTTTLAVEVHQHTWTSSDLYFDLSLSADYIKAGPDGLTDYTVNAGQVVRFVCQSSDADLPAQGITYALGGDAPLGAGIDPRTGLFTWNPDTRDGPAVITFTIIATDDGTPPMTDSRNFDVTVYAPITSGDLRLENGVVIWNTLPGDQYRIEYCDELRNADWNILETRTATGMTEAFTDPAFSTVKKRFYRIISLRYAE